MKDLVSVVLPVYNSEQFIEETLKSVLNQSYTNLEILVINDCSTDKSASKIEKYSKFDSRIKLINLKKNMGAPAGPRNIGLQNSTGEWIAFIDSDDIWHPKKIECQINLLKKHNKLFCSAKSSNFTDIKNLPFQVKLSSKYSKIDFLSQLTRHKITNSSVLIKKKLFKNIKFNESLKYKAREDVDCWLKVHEIIDYSIKLNDIMVGYRINDNQISSNKIKMLFRHLYVLKNYIKADGSRLGYKAYFFTFTHFFLSLYFRAIKKEL